MKRGLLLNPVVIAVIFILTGLSSCKRDNAPDILSKSGLELKPNEKLLNITWKDINIWCLTEDTISHVKYFREFSAEESTWENEIIVKQ